MSAADPVSASIVRAGLASTAREIFARFVRTSLLPTIYEAHDFSVAVFDDRMDVVADASGLPEYVGSLSFTVRAIVSSIGVGRLHAGDVVICSQPYVTGAHPPDIAVVAPVFVDGGIIGFIAIRGHMGDSGARNAYPADAASTYEEGLTLPPVKLYRAGEVNEEIADIVAANSRLPRETVGNLKAACSAALEGTKRVAALFRTFGPASFRLGIDELLDGAERIVREVVRGIPDGDYVVTDVLDQTGTSAPPIPLTCTVRIRGSEIEVDTTGSAPEQPGALNVPYAQTVAACRLALKRLSTEDSLPANAGEYRCLTVTAPVGSIYNARPPKGSFMMHVAATLLSEMVVTALMPTMPERVPAPSGGHTTALLAEIEVPGRYVQGDDVAPIGLGATALADGTSALQHFSVAGISTMSAEVAEAQSPVLKVSCALAPDTGGPGRWRGGLGTRVEWRFDAPANLTLQGERLGALPDTGRAGGGAGTGRNDVQVSAGTDRERSAGMSTDVPIRTGDIVVLHGAGGGGYGDPFERDPLLVVADVREGLVSPESALLQYGVVVDHAGVTHDPAATTRARRRRAHAQHP